MFISRSLLFFLLLITSNTFGFANEKDDRPNIILVMADDQGWGDMAYNGHPVVKTPHFDRMAANGMRFDRFYAAAPVCSPTRASVLTGRHPNRMGVFKWGFPIRPQEQTIAEILKAEGYSTGHFGKWHLGSVRRKSPVNPGKNGFENWISAPNFYDNDPILSNQGKAVAYQGESSIVTMQLAIDWIKSKSKDEKPFLAVVWFGSPHGPHQAAEEDKKLYPDQPRNKQNFLGEVTGMDRAMGMLQSSLDELKIRNNTIVWYTSDNGALPRVGSTGGFRGRKAKVYEGGLLVPCIIQWPAKIQKPMRTKIRGNTCDIFPTLLAVAKAKTKPKHPLDGISLLPMIEGKEMSHRPKPMGFWDYKIKGKGVPSAKWMADLLAAQEKGNDLEPDSQSVHAAKMPEPKFRENQSEGHAAWIEGDWKLHRFAASRGAPKYELYDLKEDPYEKNDISEKHPEKLKRMKSELDVWLRNVISSLNGADYDEK